MTDGPPPRPDLPRDPAVSGGARTPVLHLLAGPNGAGKSTFVARVLSPRTRLPFINADVIAAERWPEDAQSRSYEAAQIAAGLRARLLTERRSFITETVFSHPSKVDLVAHAGAAGYVVWLHVILVPEDTTVRRVTHRVDQGGHTVPEEKIRTRYERLWPLVVQARGHADHTIVYDNSLARSPFRRVAAYRRGALVGAADWPAWTPPVLRA